VDCRDSGRLEVALAQRVMKASKKRIAGATFKFARASLAVDFGALGPSTVKTLGGKSTEDSRMDNRRYSSVGLCARG
jgi:hypothetical protein